MKGGQLLRLLPLFSAVFIDLFSFGLMYPVIILAFNSPEVTAGYPGSLHSLYLSLAFSLFPFGMFFGATLLGDLSDAIGRKRTLLICMAGLAFSYVLMWIGLATLDLGWLLAGRLFSGLMAGSGPIAQAAMLDMSTPEQRGSAMSNVVLVNCLALVMGPALGGFLVHLHLQAPMIFAVVLCILAGLWIAFGAERDVPSGERLSLSWKQPFLVFARALGHPAVSKLALSFLLFQLGFGLYYIYVMVRMTQAYGLNAAQLGLFSGLLGVGFSVGSLVGYRIAAAWLKNDRRVAIAGLVGCTLFILLASLPMPGILQWVLGFATAVSNLLAFVGLLTLIGSSVGEQERGWALGIGGSMTALAFFVSGLMALVEAYISNAVLMAAGGIIVALGLLPLGALKEEPRPVAQSAA